MTRTDATDAPAITSLDLLAGGSLLLVALLGWASLALAHVGHHSVPSVIAVTVVGALLLVAVCRRARVRVPWRPDRAGVAVALGCAAIAGALTFPGFSYGVADKDPGGYVSHAATIARTGSYAFTDEAEAAHLPVQLTSPGARFSGVWLRDEARGQIVPQFYHLWPALLAGPYELAGFDGIRGFVPVMGLLAVLCMVALMRRLGAALGGPLASLAAAGAGGLLLATNMLEVWQARFPTTEVLAEALYLGALLGIVVALQTGWRPAAGLAGLLVGIGWLNRADGLLLVLLSAGVGAALFAARRWDGRATWYAAGLGVVAPHALVQAYDLCLNYTQVNSVPSLGKVTLLLAVMALLALALRTLGGPLVRSVVRLLEGARSQPRLGFALCVLFAGLLALGFLRGVIFGEDYLDYNGVYGRSYDEAILRRLSWLFTLPGFALMGLGVAVVALRRWKAPLWAAVVPTLVIFPVYAYSARNSTRLLWWARRYVPTVMPGIIILMGLALAFACVWRFRDRPVLRVPAVLVLGALAVTFLGESLPLRHHDEWAGSTAVTSGLVRLSGSHRGIYFWRADEPCCLGPMSLFATPVWLQGNQLSVLLPRAPEQVEDTLGQYHQHFPDRPIFIVGAKGKLPPGVTPQSVTLIERMHLAFPMWDESDEFRPTAAHMQKLDFAVWRLVGT